LQGGVHLAQDIQLDILIGKAAIARKFIGKSMATTQALSILHTCVLLLILLKETSTEKGLAGSMHTCAHKTDWILFISEPRRKARGGNGFTRNSSASSRNCTEDWRKLVGGLRGEEEAVWRVQRIIETFRKSS
jgi:hypothetical protein